MFGRLVAISVLSLGLFATSCGGDDDELSAQDACYQLADILCDKFFNCFTSEQLTAAQDVVGLNAADCKTKYKASECNADAVKCDLGETYHADQASSCVAQYKGLSCTDVMAGDDMPTPAACNLICSK